MGSWWSLLARLLFVFVRLYLLGLLYCVVMPLVRLNWRANHVSGDWVNHLP